MELARALHWSVPRCFTSLEPGTSSEMNPVPNALTIAQDFGKVFFRLSDKYFGNLRAQCPEAGSFAFFPEILWRCSVPRDLPEWIISKGHSHPEEMHFRALVLCIVRDHLQTLPVHQKRKIRKMIRANDKFLKQIFEVQLLCANLAPLRHKHNCPTSQSVRLLWIPVWGCSDHSGATGTMALSQQCHSLHWAQENVPTNSSCKVKPNRKTNLCQTRWFIYLQVKPNCSLPLLSGQEFSSAF